MAHFTEIRIGKVARALAAASFLAVAVIAAPAGQAHAAQNNGTGTPGTSSKSCTDPDGNTVPAGTVWTSTTQNGQVASRYKCNGKTGQWDRMNAPPRTPAGPKAPTTGTKKAF